MKMKTLASAALLACAACAMSAQATVRTFEFSATVDYLNGGNGETQQVPGLNGASWFAIGDVLNGRLTFDDAVFASQAGSGQTWPDFAESIPVSAYSVSVAGRDQSFALNGSILGSRTGQQNTFWLSSTTSDYSALSYLVSRGVWGDGSDIPSGDSYVIDGALMNGGKFSLSWVVPGATNIHNLGAVVSDFTEVSAVPEPATYSLLLAGLGAVGLMARRRRNAAAH